jgi:hypothetical protein
VQKALDRLALQSSDTGERETYGTTKGGVTFHCRDLPEMSEESRAALEAIVDHAASLSEEELAEYAAARQSVVDARSAPTPADQGPIGASHPEPTDKEGGDDA